MHVKVISVITPQRFSTSKVDMAISVLRPRLREFWRPSRLIHCNKMVGSNPRLYSLAFQHQKQKLQRSMSLYEDKLQTEKDFLL